MKHRLPVLGSLIVALAVLLGSTPAQATSDQARDASVSIKNVNFLANRCYTQQISAYGSSLTVTGPNGFQESNESWDESGDLSTEVYLCAGDAAPGTYKVFVDGERQARFTVAQPVLPVYRYSKRVVVGKLLMRGALLKHKRVTLEVAIDGYWYELWTDTSGSTGTYGVECRKGQRCAFTLRYTYEDFTGSKAFQLYTGPANGRAPATLADARADLVRS